MGRLQKMISVMVCIALLSSWQIPVASAVGILPRGTDCEAFLEKGSKEAKTFQSEKGLTNFVQGDTKLLERTLGCAMKSGRIRLYMMPFFVTFVVQFLLQIAGLVAVLFVVYGGYRYVVGGLTEDKESGKKSIIHALIGLVVALSAWMVINFLQIALTS